MAKSKLFNVFEELSFPKLETLTLAFYSWYIKITNKVINFDYIGIILIIWEITH